MASAEGALAEAVRAATLRATIRADRSMQRVRSEVRR